ncbi:MAG: HD domain-containing protein [Erysipelotrichaceae bacterium]
MDTIQAALYYAKQQFEHEAGGHDFHHTLRVYRMAMRLAAVEGGDPQIIALAAILHDVDDYKLFGSPQGSTLKAESFMRDQHLDLVLVEQVAEIIRTLSFRGTDSTPCETLEGKIVQDADRLDAIGAIGIARAFAFGGNRNRIMHDPDIPPNLMMDEAAYKTNKGTTLNHFYEKLLYLKDRMNTDAAKEIAAHRHHYLEAFLQEFHAEWNAEDTEEHK